MSKDYEYKSGVILQDGDDIEISTLLTYDDVANILGVHKDTVRRMVNAGKIDVYKFGTAHSSNVRFRMRDVDKLLLEKRRKNAKKIPKDERSAS